MAVFAVPNWAAVREALFPTRSRWIVSAGFWVLAFLLWLAYYALVPSDLSGQRLFVTAFAELGGWLLLFILGVTVGWAVFGSENAGRLWKGAAALAMLVATALLLTQRLAVLTWLGLRSSPVDAYLAGALPTYLNVLASFLALGYGLRTTVRTRLERDRLERVESALAHATLQAATLRIQPDLVSRLLGSIEERIPTDPAGADQMLMDLADFLRANLHCAYVPRVALRRELELVQARVLLETRGGRRVRLRWRVSEGAAEAQLPGGTVLALVKHVLAAAGPHSTPRVRVAARLRGGHLEILVSDDLPVPVEARHAQPGWERIRQLLALSGAPHLGASELTLAGRRSPGARATLRIDQGAHPAEGDR